MLAWILLGTIYSNTFQSLTPWGLYNISDIDIYIRIVTDTRKKPMFTKNCPFFGCHKTLRNPNHTSPRLKTNRLGSDSRVVSVQSRNYRLATVRFMGSRGTHQQRSCKRRSIVKNFRIVQDSVENERDTKLSETNSSSLLVLQTESEPFL